MKSLYVSDLLNKKGFNPQRVKLIRHSLKHDRFRHAYEQGYVLEYTQMQKPNFYDGIDYVLSFIGDEGTTAKFVGCYKVTGKSSKISGDLFPPHYPPELLISEQNIFHELIDAGHFEDLEDRLYIEWGKGTVNWHQKGSNEKPILKIGHVPKFEFTGYENIILQYNDLKEILADSIQYSEWHTAFKSVYAIYLITVLGTGQQYVGAAYGQDSLLQRWRNYIETKHGGNKLLKSLVKEQPGIYNNFQFSILQVVPKNMTKNDVIELEGLYKKKLRSRIRDNKNGLNDN